MDYIQFLGFLGLILVILSFQQKQRSGILSELFVFLSVAVGIARFDLRKRNSK
ncbi:MAG: hypothetical protein UV46_C0026G0016 [Candidatus Gottesmanbacteria bacterium GW2011_GWC2_42_8]|nr:MAG: hypothetical protein UV46_C0026G0016 [Candidatus Gottesmanbacteria bacterium GW2011_GWC2_42_8]